MSTSVSNSKVVQILSSLIIFILVLVPFHAFFTTWLGANFGHLDLFRIWKELLLVLMSFVALWLVYKNKKLKSVILSNPILTLTLIYILLHLGTGFYAYETGNVNANALIYALIINLRFLVFFWVCWVIAAQTKFLKTNWQKYILLPAAVVIVFGILQHIILPNNFLTHFGYGPKTIPAYQAVDLKPQYIRVQSTLRGANPLGAYLLVIITVLVGLLIKKKYSWFGWLLFGSGLVLFFTYSRSAWLGTVLSVSLIIYWSAKKQKIRKIAVFSLLASMLVLGMTTLALRHNSLLENTLFHTDQTSRSSESSNAVRTQAMLDGVKSVYKQPLGQGPGTAGPASFRNDHPARIAENYFVQIGQEVGIIGLGIFIAINILVAMELWHKRADRLSLILLASLVGLTMVNLLSHAWADDTLAYIWWGLAGIALAPSAILLSRTKNEQ